MPPWCWSVISPRGARPTASTGSLGSIAYVGACRANHLFVADPHDPTGRRVLMLDNGGNVAPPAPTLAYTIEDHGRVPAVAWLPEPIPITIAQAMRRLPARSHADEQAFARRECDLWLREILAAGPVSHAEILTAGSPNGFTRNTLRRAKKRLGARSCRQGFGPGSRLYWQLKRA